MNNASTTQWQSMQPTGLKWQSGLTQYLGLCSVPKAIMLWYQRTVMSDALPTGPPHHPANKYFYTVK